MTTGFTEYEAYDGVGLAELVRGGEVHPRELVEAAIERIERRDPQLNAVIDKLYDRGRRVAEQPLPAGPLAGVPYLLKDMVLHAGTQVSFGSELMRRARLVPDISHEVIARSERAGLIVLGKTNACELGLLPVTEPRAYGPTRNPWSVEHTAGGSSGGAGAAVAAGIVPLAHASDGGGSIRIPGAVCGLFGLKPSRGRNPGMHTDQPDGITVEHCVSRSVRDSAALLDATCGARGGDKWWAPAPERPFLEEVGRDPGRLRVAFSTADYVGRPAHADCVEAVERAASLCRQLGHEVVEARPAVDGQRFVDCFIMVWSVIPAYIVKTMVREGRRQSRAGELIARLLGQRAAEVILPRMAMGNPLLAPFERRTHQLMAVGRRFDPADLWLAWSDMQQAAEAMGRFLGEHDVYLTPTLGEPPLLLGELDKLRSFEALKRRTFGYVGYTPICNTAGLPAMTVPLSWNAEGLPIGVHFAGRFGDEATLIRLAAQLERAQPWADRRPVAFRDPS